MDILINENSKLKYKLEKEIERFRKHIETLNMDSENRDEKKDSLIIDSKKKDEKIERKRLANVKSGLYRRPLVKDSKSIMVDQTKQLENSENQQRFMDEMDAEEVPGGKEGGPIWFAGKKKRAIKKKRTA